MGMRMPVRIQTGFTPGSRRVARRAGVLQHLVAVGKRGGFKLMAAVRLGHGKLSCFLSNF